MSSELFRAATEYAREVTSGLDVLTLPTPCEGWDTGTVVSHLADVATALVVLVETGELRMPDVPGAGATDRVGQFHDSLSRLERTLAAAGGSERAVAAMNAGTIELTMHGWDIGVASDPGHRVPERLAGDVLVLATSLIADDARGARFGPRIDLPTPARTSDRLAAFLGREPVGIEVSRVP